MINVIYIYFIRDVDDYYYLQMTEIWNGNHEE